MAPERLPQSVMTARLVLRCWVPADAPVLAAAVAASVDHLRPWMPWIVHEPLALADRVELLETWDEAWRAGGDVVYGVWREGVVVGGCGLHRRIGPGGLEIGYWIHVDHIRRGYATELAQALTSCAFAQPGIDRVEIHHDKANVASAAIPRVLGYQFVGESPDDPEAPGENGINCTWRRTL